MISGVPWQSTEQSSQQPPVDWLSEANCVMCTRQPVLSVAYSTTSSKLQHSSRAGNEHKTRAGGCPQESARKSQALCPKIRVPLGYVTPSLPRITISTVPCTPTAQQQPQCHNQQQKQQGRKNELSMMPCSGSTAFAYRLVSHLAAANIKQNRKQNKA